MKTYCARAAREHFDVPGNLVRREGDELADDIEAAAAEVAVARAARLALDRVDAPGQEPARRATVENRDAAARARRLRDAGQRNVAGPADEENFQAHVNGSCRPADCAGPPSRFLRQSRPASNPRAAHVSLIGEVRAGLQRRAAARPRRALGFARQAACRDENTKQDYKRSGHTSLTRLTALANNRRDIDSLCSFSVFILKPGRETTGNCSIICRMRGEENARLVCWSKNCLYQRTTDRRRRKSFYRRISEGRPNLQNQADCRIQF